MAVLRTLPGRIKTLNTRRVNILKGEQRRVSGSARVSLKRHIWLRDAGQCCLCGRVVDLCDSELDHRIALQFGGGNEETNLWTLCTECHRQKSAREVGACEAIRWWIKDGGRDCRIRSNNCYGQVSRRDQESALACWGIDR
ncbi:HNH endonuclease [Escherichia coli]|nr:HNH endonuclease [Escherichia coli]